MIMPDIKIKINDKEIQCLAGETVMEAALRNDIYVPALCEHPDFPHKANCRICVVEIEGRKTLATSCSTEAQEGMIIRTDTDRVKKARNLNIEMLFAEHIEKCATCIWRVNCKLLDLADRYKILITTFKDRKGGRKTLKFGEAIEIDGTQCIDCRNCLDACSKMQKINYLELKGKGIDQEIVQTKDENIDCIYCGQCALHCPVGSAQEQSSWEEVEKALKDEKKIVIAQISSSSLVSIGEEFKEEASGEFYKKANASLRQLGFKYIFDDGLSNVISATKTALEVLSDTTGTIITSSCPAWVKYVEFYKPELKGKLMNLKSPHMIGGSIIKTFWARKNNIDPKNIVVVSILPCTAAKHEINKKELKADSAPVDIAITVRELAWLIKKNRMDIEKMGLSEADNIMECKIMAPLFGLSGGETMSVLEAARYLSTDVKNVNIENDEKVAYSTAGLKELDVELAGRKMHIGIVNGIGNIKEALDNLEKYDFLEVQACPGGCVGGGGQAVPTNETTRVKRAELLKIMKDGVDFKKVESEVLGWLEKNNLENEVLYKL